MGIFPNTDNTEIKIEGATILDHVELCDLAGRVLSSVKPASVQAIISTAGLANGIYLLCVKIGNSFSSQKISVANGMI